jgi:hypothetical protein
MTKVRPWVIPSEKLSMLRRGDETGGVGGSSADGGEVIETLSLPVETLVADIKARADLTPLGQVAAEEGARAGKRKAACQDDDMGGRGGSSADGGEVIESLSLARVGEVWPVIVNKLKRPARVWDR